VNAETIVRFAKDADYLNVSASAMKIWRKTKMKRILNGKKVPLINIGGIFIY